MLVSSRPMEFRIITPFSRWHNVPALIPMLQAAGCNRWVPVTHDRPFVSNMDWVQPMSVVVPEGHDPCYFKINFALDHLPPDRAVYYGFLCDDDTYDAGLINSLRSSTAEVLVVSARRYGNSPDIGGGVLVAAPENMRPCHVGLEQVFIRGDVVGNYHFAVDHGIADGELFERLGRERECAYHPTLFVNWNLLPK